MTPAPPCIKIVWREGGARAMPYRNRAITSAFPGSPPYWYCDGQHVHPGSHLWKGMWKTWWTDPLHGAAKGT